VIVIPAKLQVQKGPALVRADGGTCRPSPLQRLLRRQRMHQRRSGGTGLTNAERPVQRPSDQCADERSAASGEQCVQGSHPSLLRDYDPPAGYRATRTTASAPGTRTGALPRWMCRFEWASASGSSRDAKDASEHSCGAGLVCVTAACHAEHKRRTSSAPARTARQSECSSSRSDSPQLLHLLPVRIRNGARRGQFNICKTRDDEGRQL